MQYINSCLSLFNVVPTPKTNKTQPVFLKEYGVIVLPGAATYLQNIQEWLKENQLNGNDINQSFHKSWSTIINTPKERLVAQQILHYFSTYGLDALGVYSSELIYMPGETLNLPSAMPIKVIGTLDKNELIQRCLSMLASGIALKQSTIEDILGVIDGCGYKLTGNEDIKNKEARILIADKTGILPTNGDDLFRYIFYKATGGVTLVVNSKNNHDLINTHKWSLPNLTDAQMIELSKSFNRDSRTPIWLSIKKTNKDNIPFVNRIAKFSKKHHVPLSINVLNNLTSKVFSASKVIEAGQSANIFQLIRAINAVRFYALNTTSRYYRIRNGKGWAQEQGTITPINVLKNYEELLTKELKHRLKPIKVYYPSNLDYALPTSEKGYVGDIPMGTVITLPKTEESFLVGIHWEGDMVDLDISGDSIKGSVGWNKQYYTKDYGLMWSGDITSAPNGATEWLYCKAITGVYEIKVNSYRAEDNQAFQFILGHGSNIKENYVCDPSKIIFQCGMSMVQNQLTLGILEQGEEGLRFYIGGLGSGEGKVSKYGPQSEIIIDASINSVYSSLRLKDLMPSVDNPSDADIDLSVDKLQKDSFMKLFV